MAKARAYLKLACLFAPFVVLVLALGGFGRRLEGSALRLFSARRYEPVSHPPFRIRVARQDPYHQFAYNVLAPFVKAWVEQFQELRLAAPPAQAPLTVCLLEKAEDVGDVDLSPDMADPADREIFLNPPARAMAVVIRRDQTKDQARLQHGMAHLLLATSRPEAQWSPWFAEGLAAYAERMKPSGESPPPAPPDPWVPLLKLRGARWGDFMGPDGARYARAAHHLVSFLLSSEKYREGFLAYGSRESEPGPVERVSFENLIGHLDAVERDWKEWGGAK